MGTAATPDEILFGHLPEGTLTDSHIHIPGLDAPMPRDPVEWESWARLMLVQRERVRIACERDSFQQGIQKALCSQPHGLGAAYFTIMFGWIYEPREEEDVMMMPFLLFPRQAELLFAIDGAMQRPKGWDSSMAVPKARGVGATWCFAVDRIHRWRFKKRYDGRLVSRTEAMVDKPGDPSSWMYKFDYILERLPSWLLPNGYKTKRGPGNPWRTHMSIINPETGATIMGEATGSGIGVGGRAASYDLDEFARLRDGRLVWGQLGETTNHRFAISTHNIEDSTDFWDMVNATNGWPKTLVFEMEWHSVITRDATWLEETRQTLPDDLFQREVMMNPWAGISTWVYPKSKLITPGPHYHRKDYGPTLHALDDGYDDDFALIWGQKERSSGKLIVLDGYQGSHQPISYYGHLLKGEAVERFDWDYEARRIMDWIVQNQTWKGIFVGDRHGDNTDLTSGESPWGKLRNQFGIHVITNPPELNNLKDRRDSLNELMDNIDFADTAGAMMVLDALQNNRFPTPKGTQPTIESRRPIHDWTSHFATAMEYLAVYLVSRMGGGMTAMKPHKAVHSDWMRPRRSYTKSRRNSPHTEVHF